MSQNSKNDLGKVLRLILGQEKCLLNCTPGDQVDVGVPELELAAPPQVHVAVAPAHVVDLDGVAAPFSQRLDQVRRN